MTDYINPYMEKANLQTALVSDSIDMRDEFKNWLDSGNTKKYSTEIILSCIDKISEYALRMKISTISLWKYTDHSAYNKVYNKLTAIKLLRITDKKTYKGFVVAGELYARFLKKKSFTHKTVVISTDDKYGEKPVNVSRYTSDSIIDPEDVISWLITQPNANGTLYLENVVRQYMGILRTAPAKFENPSLKDYRSVFSYQTPEALTESWNLFKASSNYKQVNRSTSGMFSAGMGCYMRYLEHLQKENIQYFSLVEKPNDKKHETDNCTITATNSVNISEEIGAAINLVLSKKFTNGFRYSNEIEISRLRKLVSEQLGKKEMLNDNEIIKYVKAQGIEYEGKIYIISKNTKERTYQLAEDYFQQGAAAIFYNEFYNKHEFWLFESSIVSEKILEYVLRDNFKNLHFTQTYFGKTNDSIYNVLQNEILRVWNDEILQTYESLAERLKYIPQFRIERHLGQNNDFIWNTTKEFTHISKIDITEHEKQEIISYTDSEIRAHGYASISDVPLNEIVHRNYMLSISAIHNAVYSICLSEYYTKNGKIITRKGEDINALHIIKEYCKTLDRCTLGELLDFERELTGECHRCIPMEAGYDVLVRVDENSFFAERYIHFDVSAIDRAIEYFMNGGEYIPLQSVTNFAMFPHCGKSWNLFLLENYCRRFSDDFRFECLSVNSKNAGAIVRKKSRLSYADIIVDAVAKSDVSLAKQPILNFLVENGFTSTRRYTKVTELINQAKAIRNK